MLSRGRETYRIRDSGCHVLTVQTPFSSQCLSTYACRIHGQNTFESNRTEWILATHQTFIILDKLCECKVSQADRQAVYKDIDKWSRVDEQYLGADLIVHFKSKSIII